jgi:hypothetical protein
MAATPQFQLSSCSSSSFPFAESSDQRIVLVQSSGPAIDAIAEDTPGEVVQLFKCEQ